MKIRDNLTFALIMVAVMWIGFGLELLFPRTGRLGHPAENGFRTLGHCFKPCFCISTSIT